MLSNVGLSKNFLAKALAYVYYLVNKLPSSAIGGKTHVEAWSGRVARIMTHFGYLIVRPIIMSKKTGWTQGRGKGSS